MKKLIIIIFVMAACGGQAQNIKTLKKDMYGIASDATEGRFTGTPGYLKAAKYVVGQLKAAGIQPGWKAGGKKTYLQAVPFIWDDYTGSTVTIAGKAYSHHDAGFIVAQPGKAGKGKYVVLASGDTACGNAAGVVWLPNADQAKDWPTTVIRGYRFSYMHYLPDGLPSRNGAPYLLAGPEMAKQLKVGDSVTVNLKYHPESETAYNVIGVLPGKGKAIVVGAHLDHLGRLGKDIYNGANDDASGCVTELGAAKVLAAGHIDKPVYFVFFCGEELNLKGSRWFNDHLPLAAGNILMDINLEQLGSKHRSFRGVWALGDVQFKAAFEASGRNFSPADLQFSETDSVKEVLSNTDTYSFMKKGFPSLLLGSGGFDEHHTPQDKIDLIDFEHLQKAAKLLRELIVEEGK